MNNVKISDNERAVLKVLAADYDSSTYQESGFFSFAPLEQATGLDRRHVRLACRSLARKGLAEYLKGLVNSYDGTFGGAGYGATRKGAAIISPCDTCGDLAVYDYDGRKECEQHYTKPT